MPEDKREFNSLEQVSKYLLGNGWQKVGDSLYKKGSKYLVVSLKSSKNKRLT